LDGGGTADNGFAARCLLRAARWGTLATRRGEDPFASLVTPAVAPDGSVLMLLSGLAEHTRHMRVLPRCALMVTGRPDGPNWQTAPRLTVTGTAVLEPDPAARAYWLARHPYAALYADFTDFSLWRLVPEGALLVAGFGRAARLPAVALAPSAEAVAALAATATDIVGHCNGVLPEALSKVAHAAGAKGPWRMLGVDVDGIDLVQDDQVLRLAFDAPVADAPAAHAALQGLIQAARHRLG
jgi:heme iron utilization protein